jgi:hypothetical protein
MTDAVTHHADSVTHHAIPDAAGKASNRRKQVREANVRYGARRREGRVAIETFLAESLARPSSTESYADQ